MSRTVSAKMLQAAFARETGECILFLVEIDHTDWANPIRLVNNMVDVVSGGETFTAFPMDIDLPHEDLSRPVKMTITIDNIGREVGALLEALYTKPSVELSIILGSTPDVIEVGPLPFLLIKYDINALVIVGELSYEDILNERIPAGTFNPADFPGLF